MAEPPVVAAVWLDGERNYGLAVQEAGTWHLLAARYNRELTADEVRSLVHAQWHDHPDDLVSRIVDHVGGLLDGAKSTKPSFPWL